MARNILELTLYIYGFAINEAFSHLEDLEWNINRGAYNLSPASAAALVDLLKTPGAVCFETGDHDLTFVGFPVELVTPDNALGTWSPQRQQNQARQQLVTQTYQTVLANDPDLITYFGHLDVYGIGSDPDVSSNFNYESLGLKRSPTGGPLLAERVGILLDGPNKEFNIISGEEYERSWDKPVAGDNDSEAQERIIKQLCQLPSFAPPPPKKSIGKRILDAFPMKPPKRRS